MILSSRSFDPCQAPLLGRLSAFGGLLSGAAASARRNLPGLGASFGSFFFTASRSVIQPPLAPARAFDQDEATIDVGLHDLEIERGDPLDPLVTRHLLVLEGLARVLAATSEPMERCETDTAVRGAQAAEIPALHCARKALADRRAGDVDDWPTTK